MCRLTIALLAAAAFLYSGCKTAKTDFGAPAANEAPPPSSAPTSPAPSGQAQPIPDESFKEGTIDDRGEVLDASGSTSELLRAAEAALKTIYFDYDQDLPVERSLPDLDGNARWLVMHPNVRVTVEAHADERGTTEYNLDLSARRARSVRTELVRRGVAEARIEVIGKGKEYPAVAGHDEEAYRQNRRAEFRPSLS